MTIFWLDAIFNSTLQTNHEASDNDKLIQAVENGDLNAVADYLRFFLTSFVINFDE